MNTKLSLHRDPKITLIRSYQNGEIFIGTQRYAHSIIVTSQGTLKWPISSIETLQNEDFSSVFEMSFRTELVILGTGPKLVFPKAEQTHSLIDAQIGLETMDTAAACRTYNILADDGRNVVACLLV